MKQFYLGVVSSFVNRPPVLKNKFVIMSLLLLFWMIFFDKNNLITYGKLYITEYQLKQDKKNYIQSIEDIQKGLIDLEQNKERYARERYFLQRANEEVFIIIKE